MLNVALKVICCLLHQKKKERNQFPDIVFYIYFELLLQEQVICVTSVRKAAAVSNGAYQNEKMRWKNVNSSSSFIGATVILIFASTALNHSVRVASSEFSHPLVFFFFYQNRRFLHPAIHKSYSGRISTYH